MEKRKAINESTPLIRDDDNNREDKKDPRMAVTRATVVVAVFGVVTMGILFFAQLCAVLAPQSQWTIDNIYGGNITVTDSTAYFAYHQGWAKIDVFFACPLQFLASYGMLRGRKWGFLMALAAAVPPFYSSVPIFIWDREKMGGRENTIEYWAFVWGQFPLLGLVEGIYCFLRLL